MKSKRYIEAAKKSIQSVNKSSIKNQISSWSNAALYSALPKSKYVISKPISAQIEPTSRCNLKCKMCVRERFPVGDMRFEDFKIILRKLNMLIKIHLQGLGEPFLHQDIFRMLKYAKQKGIITNLNSNATLFTKDIVDKIIDSGLNEIAISIDSTNKKVFESIRIHGDFDKIVNNIKLLTSTRDEMKSKLKVSLAVTIMKKNLEELPKFVDLANKLNIDKIIFQTVQIKEDFVKIYSKEFSNTELVNTKKEQFKNLINETKRRAKKYKIDILFDEQDQKCVWPWRNIYITWQGYVTPCCKIVDFKNPVFGNIINQSFKEIWNSKTYKKFREGFLKRIPPDPCKGCNVFWR